MKLRTAVLLAGLGFVAARKIGEVRRARLALPAGPPAPTQLPPPVVPAARSSAQPGPPAAPRHEPRWPEPIDVRNGEVSSAGSAAGSDADVPTGWTVVSFDSTPEPAAEEDRAENAGVDSEPATEPESATEPVLEHAPAVEAVPDPEPEPDVDQAPEQQAPTLITPAQALPDAVRPIRRGVNEIQRFYRANETPVWCIGATPFGLLGTDRWVRELSYISHFDSFAGKHPGVLVPTQPVPPAVASLEEICNHLLAHEQVRELVGRRGGGKAVLPVFDEESERLAQEIGLEIAFPAAALRKRLDSRIEATRLADAAKVPSVPHTLGRASSYVELLELARRAQLGEHLVVQTPYAAPGQTTFFVSSSSDWAEHEARLGREHLKVMRRIEPRTFAIEGVVTRHGVLVGPHFAELTAFDDAAPLGGWCSSDVLGATLSERQRLLARRYTQAMGEQLRHEGYVGIFELELLADVDSGDVYLGELLPRMTRASSIPHVSAVGSSEMPLFLFHLLEFMDVDFEIDVDALNEGWGESSPGEEWSHLVLKDTDGVVEQITEAPASGIWLLDPTAHGGVRFVRHETDWHAVASKAEAFYLRVAGPGSYRYPGADLGILVARGRLLTDKHELTERALAWIRGIKRNFWTVPAQGSAPVPQPFSLTIP